MEGEGGSLHQCTHREEIRDNKVPLMPKDFGRVSAYSFLGYPNSLVSLIPTPSAICPYPCALIDEGEEIHNTSFHFCRPFRMYQIQTYSWILVVEQSVC